MLLRSCMIILYSGPKTLYVKQPSSFYKRDPSNAKTWSIFRLGRTPKMLYIKATRLPSSSNPLCCQEWWGKTGCLPLPHRCHSFQLRRGPCWPCGKWRSKPFCLPSRGPEQGKGAWHQGYTTVYTCFIIFFMCMHAYICQGSGILIQTDRTRAYKGYIISIYNHSPWDNCKSSCASVGQFWGNSIGYPHQQPSNRSQSVPSACWCRSPQLPES